MKAWIITYYIKNHNIKTYKEVVVGILSVRKNPKVVEDHLKFLYLHLNYSAENILSFASYNNTSLPFPIKRYPTYTRHGYAIVCGHYDHGCLYAREADNIKMYKNANQDWLEWLDPVHLTLLKNDEKNIIALSEQLKNNLGEKKAARFILPIKIISE